MGLSIEEDKLKRCASIIEHAFLQYGAGAKCFEPLTRTRLWNRICWALIVLGFLGWIAVFWWLRDFTE